MAHDVWLAAEFGEQACLKPFPSRTFVKNVYEVWTSSIAELATINKLAHSNEFYLYKNSAEINFWEISNITLFKPTIEK